MAEHRYEREIDELLRNMEGEQRAPLPFRRRRTAPWTDLWRRARTTLGQESGVERLMLLALTLVLAAFALSWLVPSLAGPVAAPLGLVALGCLIAALGLSVWNGASGRPTQYHGRTRYAAASGGPIDWDGLLWRFRRWLRRFRR